MLRIIVFSLLLTLSAAAQQQINLQTQVKGVLPIANGGTGSSSGGGVGLPAGCTSPGAGQIQCSIFSTTGNSAAGTVTLTQGTAPATVPGSVRIAAPGSVAAYNLLLPSAVGTGYLFSNAGALSFNGAATANYYTNSGNTGLGPTLFTPNNTFNLLDATPVTGNTKVWLGYDGNGSFTAGHISAVRTNLSIVRGTGQGPQPQTDDYLSFYTVDGAYRGGIVFGSNNALSVIAAVGVPLALGAAGAQDVFITTGGHLAFTAFKGQHINTQAANNDLFGAVSGTATTAVVAFTTPYTSTPACVITPTTIGITSAIITAQSNSGFTVTYAPSGNASFNYACGGNPN